jgi:hypothetical protein
MVNAREDHLLGQSLAGLLQQHGPEGLDNGRIQASLNDLLGADTALVAPLRDLLVRPGFRQLLLPSRERTQIGCREGLLDDLASTYSPAMVKRLAYLLDGVMGLPLRPHADPPRAGFTPEPTVVIPDSYVQVPPPARSNSPATPPVAPASGSGGIPPVMALLMALVAMLSGALVVGFGWMMQQQQNTSSQVSKSTSAAPEKASDPSPDPVDPVPTPEPPRRESSPVPSPPVPGSGAWGSEADYKFGRLPGGEYPDSCAFSETTADGIQKTNSSAMEYWACRDEGGNASDGYRVVWADGKSTRYTFMPNGSGMIIGTNGRRYPMVNWYNDTRNGDKVIVINHEDGSTTWIPGHVDR